MSTIRQITQTIVEVPQNIIRSIADPVVRIFRPAKDDYPSTGVQPFEGDPAREK